MMLDEVHGKKQVLAVFHGAIVSIEVYPKMRPCPCTICLEPRPDRLTHSILNARVAHPALTPRTVWQAVSEPPNTNLIHVPRLARPMWMAPSKAGRSKRMVSPTSTPTHSTQEQASK